MSDGVLTELTPEECTRLLRSQPIGRLAISANGDAPYVVPVNFTVVGDAIVFRSDLGTKLRLAMKEPVAFQVDFVDWYHRTGWSGLGKGAAHAITRAAAAGAESTPSGSGAWCPPASSQRPVVQG